MSVGSMEIDSQRSTNIKHAPVACVQVPVAALPPSLPPLVGDPLIAAHLLPPPPRPPHRSRSLSIRVNPGRKRRERTLTAAASGSMTDELRDAAAKQRAPTLSWGKQRTEGERGRPAATGRRLGHFSSTLELF